MRKFGHVAVTHAAALEPGDLIAHVITDKVVSGKITGIATMPFQLTDEQRKYMLKNDLNVPTNEYDALAGRNSVLLFGEFEGLGFTGHMYINSTANVAVFPYGLT